MHRFHRVRRRQPACPATERGRASAVAIAVAAILAAGLFGAGFMVGRTQPTQPTQPENTVVPDAPDVEPPRAVLSMPYVRGRIEADADRPTGVVVNRPEAQPGYNLIVSGHDPEALLIDMDGKTVHRWWRRLADVKHWRGEPGWEDTWPPHDHPGTLCWRRAYLEPDGSLLVIFESIGLVKLDRRSKVVWAYRGGRVHHSADVGPDGKIYVLNRVEHDRDLKLKALGTYEGGILEDRITILDPDGEVLDDFSLIDAFLDSEFAPAIEHTHSGDVLHANSVHFVTTSGDQLIGPRKGELLLSLRHLNMLAAVDIESRRVTWVLTGKFDAQHEATVVDEGRILLFDNYGNGGASRVMEIDPTTQAIAWAYPARGEDTLFSATCGTCQRLRNGNTLITESENGRAIEVDRAGEVVWDYYSPFRYLDTRVALLYDVRRIDKARVQFELNSPPEK